MLITSVILLVRRPLRSCLEPKYWLGGQCVRTFRSTSVNENRTGGSDDICDCDPIQEGPSKAPYYALGAIILGTGAVITYAKNDEDLRRWLQENSPTSDKFISFITAEEMSRMDYIWSILSEWKNMIVDDLTKLIQKQLGQDIHAKKKNKVGCEDTGKPYRAPHSAFRNLIKEQHDKYEEARVSAKRPGQPEEFKRIEDSDYRDKKKHKEEHAVGSQFVDPNNLLTLEMDINKSAESAIRAYFMAICYLGELSDDIYTIMNGSHEKADQKLWAILKKKAEDRNTSLTNAENAAKEAEEKLNDLKNRLDEPELPGGDAARSLTLKNIDKVLKQLDKARKDYEEARNNLSVVERLWSKVLQARQHFQDEIEFLRPDFRLADKELRLEPSDMNIFIHNAVVNTLNLQTEFAKMDTVGKQKLKSLIEMSKKGNPEAVENAIELEIEKEKRKISREYYKKLLMVRAECDHKTKQTLADQGLDFQDTLEQALAQKEKEVMRKLGREFDETIMEEKEKRREEMARVLGRLKGMDDMMRERSCGKSKSKLLWSAAEALQSAVTATKECLKTPLRSLDVEVHAVKNVIPEEDEVARGMIQALPRLAQERGVYSVIALRERFLNVMRVAEKVGFLDDGGASLPIMLFQFLKALLIITPANPIPCFEILNQPIDPEALNNFEVFQRARYFMDKGDLYQVLGYLNLLRGASRVVAQDYIDELRLFLETKLVADALLFHASAGALAF